MSAIWGIIDLSGKPISRQDCELMGKPFHSKKIDAVQSSCEGAVFMACGLQYVSEEAKKEQYPYRKGSVTMVADAIVDNRRDLQSHLSVQSPLSLDGVDGSILFDSVQQDLNWTLTHTLGAYVFAQYNQDTQTVTLANDITGTRSVYYRIDGSRFYFSSLLASFLPFLSEKKKDDQWFFNYYAQDSLRFVNECRRTPYEGIFRLEPGEVLTFSKNGLQRKAYWEPIAHRKNLKLPNHEAYAQKVRQVFGRAVEDLIRGDRDTAILLSGGLDSNAVAAFAAPKLREYGKKLCSFTSVPDADKFQSVENTYYVPDERRYVELLQNKHPNLEPEWVGCNHYDYLKESRKAIDILEIPYKTIPNMPWMVDAYGRAARKGCSTLLTGQYGNVTISVGSYENLFETLLKHGRLLELDRQAKIYGKIYHRRRRWTYKTILDSVLHRSGEPFHEHDLNPNIYTTQRSRLKELEGKKYFFSSSLERYRFYMYDRVAFRQVGETELKLSLETGVIPRDPTRDPRLIELVMSLPIEELCWNGIDRRLVRQDMEGLVPDEIAKDIHHRGAQGVGADQQLKACWPTIKEELRKEYETGHAEAYLNLPYLIQRLDSDEPIRQEDTVELVRLIYCGLCSEYIGNHYEE